jgi:hypothetical protein
VISIVLSRKPSGLALVRLSCGCEQWLRAIGDRVHEGRRVRSCGPGGVHGTPDYGTRLDEAMGTLQRKDYDK